MTFGTLQIKNGNIVTDGAVLLMVPDVSLREAIRDALTAQGIYVISKKTLRMALNQTAQGGFRAVVVDLDVYPDAGEEAVKWLSAVNPLCLLVGLTANPRQSVLPAQLDAVLAKPFDVPDLLRVLEQYSETVAEVAAVPYTSQTPTLVELERSKQ